MEIAIIGLVGVIIGATFMILGTLCFGKRQRYGDTVAQRRVEWLRQLCEHVSNMLANAKVICELDCRIEPEFQTISQVKYRPDSGSDAKSGFVVIGNRDGDERLSAIKKYHHSKFRILSQLNVQEECSALLRLQFKTLDDMLFSGSERNSNDDVNKLCEAIMITVRAIEKHEWVQTKNGAKGRIRK